MSPKLSRLLLIATVAAGFGVLPMQGALADSGVDVYNPPAGFSNHVPGVSGVCQGNDPNQIPHTTIHVHNTITWYIQEGTHNITPAEDVNTVFGHGKKWPKAASGDLNQNDQFQVKFDTAGLYFYYSGTNNDGADKNGQLSGMCGVINVDVDTTPAPPPPDTTSTTTTTAPVFVTPTTSAPSGPAPTAPPATSPSAHTPTTAPPAPTTTTGKPDKNKPPKDSSTTTATTAPAAFILPPEAIIPDIGGTGTATQNGVLKPSSTPSGDAVAVVKGKHSDNAKKMLIVTGLGIGALGIGTAGYKWAHRSSKYFPA